MPSFDSDDNDVEENINIDSEQKSNIEVKNVVNRSNKSKRGGWKEALNNEEEEILKMNVPLQRKDNDSDNDIPYIPHLEEQRSDDTMAMAPQVAINRVATYKELEVVLKEHIPFAFLSGNIDLKLLMMKLLPEASIKERDEVWIWDNLLADIKSQVMANKDLFDKNNQQYT